MIYYRGNMVKMIKPEQWEPMDGIHLEEAANEVIWSENNTLVVAGPGTGKTELLAQKAGFLFATNRCAYPRKILAISFKRDAAENLRKRVVKRYGNEVKDRFVSLTYDSFAKSILDRFRLALPEGNIPNANYLVNNDDATDRIIEQAFKEEGYSPYVSEIKSSTKRFYEKTIDEINLPLCGDSFGERIWKNLLAGFGGNNSCLTFHMISKLATYIVKTERNVRRAMQLTYSHIFLDEFQDTTDLQYELVKACFLNSFCNITAVGDNKQRIMLWAGARRTVFKDFYNEFHADCKRLIMNHRSAPRLVELQKSMYEVLKDTTVKVETSDKWDVEDGRICLLISKDEKAERDWIIENIKEHMEEGISANEICILCKQKPLVYTEALIKELSDNGISARVENDYQDLLKEPIVELVISIMKLSINVRLPDEWEYVQEETLLMKGVNFNSSIDDYYSIQRDLSNLFENCGAIMCDEEKADIFKRIIKEIVNFYGKDRIKAHYTGYSQGNYLKEVLKKFIRLFDLELDRVLYDWNVAIENFEGINSIPIMTIHKSKGLEYSAVFFIGLEDSAFWNFKNQPEEDRCAFFVALSRAKRFVAFSYCEYRAGKNQRRNEINEFFELLQRPGMAEIIER